MLLNLKNRILQGVHQEVFCLKMRQKKHYTSILKNIYHPLAFHLLVSFYQVNTEADTILAIVNA